MFIGNARITPANAPYTEVFNEDEVNEQAESHPKKDAYAKPKALPIIANIIVIFITEIYKKKLNYVNIFLY